MLQALGQWPALHTVMTPASLAHLLESLADYAADPDKATTLRQAAGRARSLGAAALRESVVRLGAAALRAGLGLGPYADSDYIDRRTPRRPRRDRESRRL